MLADILHDPAARKIRESLFSWYAGQPPQPDGYRRLHAFARWAGSGTDLLAKPSRYFASLEAVALCDPFIFHTAQVHYGVCLAAALELADRPAGIEPLVAALDQGVGVGTVLITELGSGGSHLAVRTRADWHAGTGGFVLSTPDGGAAKFMPNVAQVGTPKIGLVYARVFTGDRDCGVFPFLVPIRGRGEPDEGVTVKAVPGDNPADFALVSFDGTPVTRDQWLADGAWVSADGEFHDPLGDPDRRLVRSLTVSANASAAAAHAAVAAAQGSAVIALRYAAQRTTMGRLGRDLPVLAYRSQRHPLLGALAKAYAATCLLRSVATVPAGSSASGLTFAPWAAVHREMALTKAVVTALAEEVAAVCRRRSGAQGVLSVNRITGYEALAAAYSSAAGDSFLTLLDTGRALLGELEPSTLDGSAPDRRIAAILGRLGGVPGENSLKSWDPLLEGAADLARAYAQRLMVRAMHAALDRAGDDRRLAEALLLIYVGDEFGSGSGDDLDDAFTLILDNLDHVLAAFDIPVEILGVPIAAPDYIAAFNRG